MSSAWLDGLSESERDRIARSDMPTGHDLMQATLTHESFSDPDWIYERKLDGERVLAIKQGGQVRLRTRNDKDAGVPYPEIAEALAGQVIERVALDGEVVAFEGAVTSFARLQQRMQKQDPEEARRSGVAVTYYAFDLLNLDGYDVTGIPLRTRKRLLRDALDFAGPLRFTPHRNADGEAFLKEACQKGWEGLIAKRAAAPYVGKRSRDWLKFKCTRGQELVIGGFTEPQGSRIGFGALLVGYYEGDRLRYAGKVGTGYDEETLAELRERMDELARGDSPFEEPVREAGAHFIAPELVGQFGFTEWTEDGKLRHPRFLGLRRDKRAREVVREDTGRQDTRRSDSGAA